MEKSVFFSQKKSRLGQMDNKRGSHQKKGDRLLKQRKTKRKILPIKISNQIKKMTCSVSILVSYVSSSSLFFSRLPLSLLKRWLWR